MENQVLWLDSENAEIFSLKPEGIQRSKIKKVSHDHHTVNKKDRHGNPADEKFFQEVSSSLKDAENILILGPGLAKSHFKSFLDIHHRNDIAKRVIGVEKSDHPSDKQILAAARKYFIKYDLFNVPIRPS